MCCDGGGWEVGGGGGGVVVGGGGWGKVRGGAAVGCGVCALLKDFYPYPLFWVWCLLMCAMGFL
ncbi:hypothetical protein HHE03_17420 [Helicobacter heilmannii]|nr:hypothetical protein HHE03_17420 [Helicobacter heilmannii]